LLNEAFKFKFEIGDEIGWARSRHGREDKLVQNMVGNPEGKRHLKDLGVEERIILKLILRK
jgi:hypothetical protein